MSTVNRFALLDTETTAPPPKPKKKTRGRRNVFIGHLQTMGDWMHVLSLIDSCGQRDVSSSSSLNIQYQPKAPMTLYHATVCMATHAQAVAVIAQIGSQRFAATNKGVLLYHRPCIYAELGK
jgi:hypothetical protein